MADELNKNAEFNGRHKDEEDPILVAQRYLNIYRQLHIFNDRRRKEYNDDVINLPSNIKMLLSTIPGGGLLLEHIKELEEARGISSDVAPQVSFLDQEDSVESTTKSKSKNSSKKDSGGAVSADLIKFLRQNEEQHNREMQALTEAFIKSQESMTDMLKEILSRPAAAVPVAEPVVQPKPEPVQKEPVQAETEEPQKTLDEILPEADQIQEDKTSEKEEKKEETSSIFGNLAKRLFSSHKAEQDTPNIAKPDHTPVSLEDISDTPVSLDENRLVEDSQISTLLDDIKQDANSEDSEWEWDYVDDSLPQSSEPDSVAQKEDDEWEYIETPQDSENDEEWEYVEEPQETTSVQKEQNAEDDEWEYVEAPENEENNTEEWEYVETPQDSENDEEWEYVEEPQETTSIQKDQNSEDEDKEEWEYVEAPEDAENPEEWEYVEAPGGIENTEEWEYIEEPQETAQDLSEPVKDTKE